jgi:hypothetical protein
MRCVNKTRLLLFKNTKEVQHFYNMFFLGGKGLENRGKRGRHQVDIARWNYRFCNKKIKV